MNNSNLHAAKTAKNDEFYTQLNDIADELKHYTKHFKDKVIYCNCDDPEVSNFWVYFHKNFKAFGLKKLIATHYVKEGTTYKMEYLGGDDNDPKTGIVTPFKGDGGFTSSECVEVLREANIVVTNPPFSLWREFINLMIAEEKDFIILGNANAVTYKNVFPLFKANEVQFGVLPWNKNLTFITPDGSYKTIQVMWYTTLTPDTKKPELVCTKDWTPEEYPRYDNYPGINVNSIKDIPKDYYGAMGVPITYLAVYDPAKFRILRFRKGLDDKDLCYTVNGERIQPYFRLLIKRRP